MDFQPKLKCLIIQIGGKFSFRVEIITITRGDSLSEYLENTVLAFQIETMRALLFVTAPRTHRLK